jgi:hypothetical protein
VGENLVIEVSDSEEAFFDGEFSDGLGGVLLFVGEELVKVVLCFLGDFADVLIFFLGGVFEGEADGTGDHGFEFVFLLNFIAVISD